jgi:hypothetical protein
MIEASALRKRHGDIPALDGLHDRFADLRQEAPDVEHESRPVLTWHDLSGSLAQRRGSGRDRAPH